MAHRLARGEDDFPPDLRRPAPDLATTWQFELPAERIEGCAFVAKMLADELHTSLSTEGLACIRVAIEAETEQGQIQLRLWRHEGTLSAAAIADRTRWQLDSWLRSSQGGPTAGIVRLTLIPDEVVPATGRQLGFWGGRNERAGDVTRVVARLQAMLDPEAVSVPELRGGIGPGERITLVPAAAVDLAEERPAAEPSWRSMRSRAAWFGAWWVRCSPRANTGWPGTVVTIRADRSSPVPTSTSCAWRIGWSRWRRDSC